MPLPQFHHVYIADGFAEDCNHLLQDFLKSENINFKVFSDIWKKKKFANVFHGRKNGAEVAELSEEYLIVAKNFMINKTNTYQESVAGLFLLYSLAHTQPYKEFANVRITPEDVAILKKIEDGARERRNYDVLYILGSLLISGPVHFTLTDREHGLEKPLRKYFEGQLSMYSLNSNKGVMYRQNEELDTLRQLSVITRKYMAAKAAIPGNSATNRSLNFADGHLATELTSSLKALVRPNNVSTERDVTSHHDTVIAIKEKAMKRKVKKKQYIEDPSNSAMQTNPPRKRKPYLNKMKNSPSKISSSIQFASSSESEDDWTKNTIQIGDITKCSNAVQITDSGLIEIEVIDQLMDQKRDLGDIDLN